MKTDDADPSRYVETNQRWWDGVVPIHEASGGYDRDGFLRGEKPLCPVELAELGPRVAGRTLLHLQCHFGMDTLSWARLGAHVTGLDFSGPAIEAARRLSSDSGIAGRFVQADPACIRPGGLLYVYEGHPMLWALDERRDDGQLIVSSPYFEQREPTPFDSDVTYVDGPKLALQRTYTWNHGLGEIVTALIESGLRVEFLHEHREVPWQALPIMEVSGPSRSGADGRYQSNRMWRLPVAQREQVPLMYSLLATKPG